MAARPPAGLVASCGPRSLVATPTPAPTHSFATQSFEPDPLDVRLHAPTTDTVIVWVAGPIRRADAPLLTLRVRQQFKRALHVILDVSSVTRTTRRSLPTCEPWRHTPTAAAAGSTSPARPASASPTAASIRPRPGLRRAYRAVKPGICSTKVRFGQPEQS